MNRDRTFRCDPVRDHNMSDRIERNPIVEKMEKYDEHRRERPDREGLLRRDRPRRQGSLLALVAEDIEWIIPGEDWPLAGTRRGHAGLADVLETASKTMETNTTEPREFVAQGDRVLVVGFATGKIKATNKPFEDDWIFAITVRDGKLTQHPGIHRHAGTGAGLADGRVRASRSAGHLRPSRRGRR